jgi:universal stress protein A
MRNYRSSMQVKKILCPTDLSLNSANGVAYAFSLAIQYRADLIVLYVASVPPVPLAALREPDLLTFDRRIYAQPSVDQILSQAKARLDAFMNPLLSRRCQTHVALGEPAEEITYTARRARADLIVIARRDMGIFRRLISRSISERLSREAPCPVLSICPQKIRRPIVAKARPAVTGIYAGAEA